MNLIDRAEIWFNCRKIELSAWLKDSKKSYTTRYNPDTGEYSTVGCQSFKPGTPESEAMLEGFRAKQKAYAEQQEKLCALDPAYKARYERKKAKERKEYEDHLSSLPEYDRNVLIEINERNRQRLNK